jgi:hypothetical protein
MAPVRVFISYSSRDESLRKELDSHLSLLKREGIIDTWTFRDIDVGSDWRSVIHAQLEAADIIILLVSVGFIESDYCWEVELRRALQRHREGTARVVPVLLSDCDWSSASFAAIQMLPPSAKPVTNWRPRAKAWTAVAEALRRIASVPPTQGLNGVEPKAVHPESAVQRARRLAGDSRARKVREDKLRHEGVNAVRAEAEAIYRSLETKAHEITTSVPEICMESGWGDDHCVVRLKPLREKVYELSLHCYQYVDGYDVENSHLNVRLVFGGMILPQERNMGYFGDGPKEYTKDQYKFRLTPEGQWLWSDPSSEELLKSPELADRLLQRLPQLHDDIEAGRVKQPRSW